MGAVRALVLAAKARVFDEFTDKRTIPTVVAKSADAAIVPDAPAGLGDFFDIRIKVTVVVKTA